MSDTAVREVDLLVIAAHPDDAELSIAGTLLVSRARGFRTGVIELTLGELSTRGNLETRAEETRRATEILGLTHRECLGLADGEVRDSHEAREKLVTAVRRLRPKVVLAPWREDLHPDHAGAGELTARMWYLCGVKRFAPGQEPYRPPLLGYYMLHTPFPASVVVDITSHWQQKLEAIRAFGSQFHQENDKEPPTKISQPHFITALEGRAREYGLQVGCEFGEPLIWHQPPRVLDPVSMEMGVTVER